MSETTPAARDRSWDFENLRYLLYGNIGFEFGKNPEEQFDKIRESRGEYAAWLIKRLKLSESDVVADLGSGVGLVASHIAPRVGRLICMDISQPFLEQCKKTVGEGPRTEFHLVPYADLSCLEGKGVTKLYSTAVFIHFNVYDAWLYLLQCSKYLKSGGLLGFDFADTDSLDPNGPEWGDHVKLYQSDRSKIVLCMNYHSLSGIDRLLQLTGFERVQSHKWARSIFVVAKKR